MNIQDWFPLRLTGLISLQSKGLSRVFFNTVLQKHQLFGAQLSLSEKEMATHSSVLAWKIPWMEKPGRLQSMGSQRLDTPHSEAAAAEKIWDRWQQASKRGKFSPCQSSSLQGPVEARVVRVSFYFSTFKLAGKNICEASFLGTAALVKICCEHSCSFTDPFPPRDDHCFSLSLSLLSFLIRWKTIG